MFLPFASNTQIFPINDNVYCPQRTPLLQAFIVNPYLWHPPMVLIQPTHSIQEISNAVVGKIMLDIVQYLMTLEANLDAKLTAKFSMGVKPKKLKLLC